MMEGRFEKARECLEELRESKWRKGEVLEAMGDLVFRCDKEWLRAFDLYS